MLQLVSLDSDNRSVVTTNVTNLLNADLGFIISAMKGTDWRRFTLYINIVNVESFLQ